MPEDTDAEETTVETTEEEEDQTEDTPKPQDQPNNHLKPDPEDARLKEEAKLLDEPFWIEQCFDPDYDHPKLSSGLSRFLATGYAKLGRKLSQELISDGLSMVAKTISGLSHAYVKLDLIGKAVIEISILKNFAHLRYVSLAGNHIFDVKPLNSLEFLMALDISDNYLSSMADFKVHVYLKVLNVSKNFLKDLKGVVEHPYLRRLYLSYNKLTYFTLESPKYLRELEVLELRKNRLKTFGEDNLKLPALKSLFLAQNYLEHLGKFSMMKKLEFLDLRRNKLKSLAGCELPHIRYLNVAWNFITDLSEIEKLAVAAPDTRTLIMKNNAVNGDEKAQTRAIVHFKKLTRLNAVIVDKLMRQDAVAEFAEEQEDEKVEEPKEPSESS